MNTTEQIEGLKRLLYREAAISLLNFQRAEGEQTRSWDDLTPEEQQARMDFAADCLRKTERPELFSDSSDHISGRTKIILTPEQQNAIDCSIRAMDFASNDHVFRESIKQVLREMLSQSRPGWEATEERILALQFAVELMALPDLNSSRYREREGYGGVLSDMLAEVLA